MTYLFSIAIKQSYLFYQVSCLSINPEGNRGRPKKYTIHMSLLVHYLSAYCLLYNILNVLAVRIEKKSLVFEK